MISNEHSKSSCPFLQGNHLNVNNTLSRNLHDMIQQYNAFYKQCLDDVLDMFQDLSVDDTIKYAALSRCKICDEKYPHQWRLSNETLQKFYCSVITKKEKIIECKDFEQIYDIINRAKVRGIGNLTVYDTSLRIGAKLNLFPEKKVYAFNGASIAGQNGRHIFDRNEFKEEFANMSAYHIEDFLCVYKVQRENYDIDVLRPIP